MRKKSISRFQHIKVEKTPSLWSFHNIWTRQHIECLSSQWCMALLSLDRYDFFLYNLELYCQNAVSHFVPVLTGFDGHRKIYAAHEAAIGDFQIMEYTVLFDDRWCYPVALDKHVSAA